MTSNQQASLLAKHQRPVPASRLELWAIDRDAASAGADGKSWRAHLLNPLVVEDARLPDAQQPRAVFAQVAAAAPSDAAYIISLCSRTGTIDHCAIDAQMAQQIFAFVSDWQDARLRVPGAVPQVFVVTSEHDLDSKRFHAKARRKKI